MGKLASVLSGAAALAVFMCSPPPAERQTALVRDTAAAVVPTVADSAASAVLTVPVAAPAADSASAADTAAARYNDTAVVRRILDECGLITVKPEVVAEWDSAGRAVSLDLSNKDLSTDGISAVPAAICSLTELKTLAAKNNCITAIPLELFELKKLVKLDLAGNKIAFVPGAIKGLENLENLDLRHNEFGYLPPEVGELKRLVSLQLWGNKIVELEPAVTELPALKELYLKDNRLTTLPEGITKMKSLVYYDLGGNAICAPSPRIDAWLKKKDKRYREAQRCR